MGIFEAIKLALLAFVEASKDFKLLVGVYTKFQEAKWKEALSEAKDALIKPMTVEEKANVAKKLTDLISGLG